MRLADKMIVITGGATGIGAAAAEVYAQHGATVVIADINTTAAEATVRRIHELGGETQFIRTDVGRPADIRALIDQVHSRYQRIDVLHNNAACFDGECPLADTTLEQWEKVIDVNLRSIFLSCHATIPLMLRQGGGVIINTASVLSAVGASNFAAYIASKGGIAQLTRSIAVDYGRQGIRANALCPGITASEIAQKTLDNTASRDALVAKTVLGRVASPREIANAALFLASDESSYVTGTCLFVDGGWTCM
jgi:NAD(P)-dependent dehydrogenase (short-subunit alcohol dehydrogenase family)